MCPGGRMMMAAVQVMMLSRGRGSLDDGFDEGMICDEAMTGMISDHSSDLDEGRYLQLMIGGTSLEL